MHLPNSKVGQVLTHTPIPLPFPGVGGPKWAQGNFVASNHPHSCCEQSKARMLKGKNDRYPDLT